MTDAILTLNAGSSSLKFALLEIPDLTLVLRGQVDAIQTAPHFLAKDGAGAVLTERRWSSGQTHEALFGAVLDWLDGHLGEDRLVAVGHRVVHGGPAYAEPVLVDDAVLAALDALTPLAPLHEPHNVAPMRAIGALRPGLPQVACFDTAFHHGMPALAQRVAVPRSFWAEGVRRYGFHGLSYEFIARRLAEVAPALAEGRTIVAHLGNGASLCAMLAGRSVETTMSFTALDGLVMGTRCGSIDPGVVLYLQQRHGMDARQVQALLYEKSGLLGVSGVSGDMRALQASRAPSAAEAVELFVYRLAREAASLVGVLGGLDGLVFTAGIGEHDAAVRAMAAARLGWLGVVLDPAANARGEGLISAPESRVAVWVVPTDEEWMIASHSLALLPDAAQSQTRS